MQIKIKLTPAEFTVVDEIVKGRQPKNQKIAAKLMNGGLLFETVENMDCSFNLTIVGHLAWEQNQKKGEKPKDDVYAQCVDFWLKNFHPGFTFGGVQGKAMKSLINKIRTISTNPTDETVVATFQKLCQSLPEWYKTKDLPVLDSKFNDIVAEIQQGPKLKWTPLNSAAHLFFGNE